MKIDMRSGAPILQDQLQEQGVFVSKENRDLLTQFERDRRAIGRLYSREIITEAEYRKAGQRLLKRINEVTI